MGEMGIEFARLAYVWNKLYTHVSHFHSLEIVCRGSDIQLQVGENSHSMT